MSNKGKAWLSTLLLAAAILGGGVWWSTRLPTEPATAPAPAPDRAVGTATALYQDVTPRSGVDFCYRNGQEANHYSILESLGGGVALLDYDGDGLLDVFVTGGGGFQGKEIVGRPCRLYRNLGHWKFQDVTAEVLKLDGPWFYTHGCAVGDYDRDGWPDLLVTGYGRVALFHNCPGPDGRQLVEVTRQAGLRGGHFWGTSAAWGDLDGDGYPDLYVCQYVNWSFANDPFCEGYRPGIERDVCPPREFDSRPHALYHNKGDGTFTEVSKSAGLHTERTDEDYRQLGYLSPGAKGRLREADRERDFGKGLGVLLVDVNGDGRPDIYVANDTTDKFLYINRSRRGRLRFEDLALDLGVARDDQGAPNGSMGLDAADYDGSGLPSLLVANYQNELPALYRNVSVAGQVLFQYSSRDAGLDHLGQANVGFGTGFLDVDNDGWEDIVMVNGHVIRHPEGSEVRQRPLLLHNEGRKPGREEVRFVDVSARAGDYFRTAHQGRGLAVGDLDNDGRPDLVVSHINEPIVLLRNEDSSGNHWLGIELADRGHRDVVGARLTLEVEGRRLTRFARGGGSYLSSGDRRHLFGLGQSRRVGRLTVRWPWGQTDSWEGLAVDRYWRVLAGERSAQEWPRPPK